MAVIITLHQDHKSGILFLQNSSVFSLLCQLLFLFTNSFYLFVIVLTASSRALSSFSCRLATDSTIRAQIQMWIFFCHIDEDLVWIRDTTVAGSQREQPFKSRVQPLLVWLLTPMLLLLWHIRKPLFQCDTLQLFFFLHLNHKHGVKLLLPVLWLLYKWTLRALPTRTGGCFLCVCVLWQKLIH